MPDAAALVEARTALATLQSELATAHKQWDEGGKNWDAVTILSGNDFDKYQAMMEKETKANELGQEVERLAALESSQGMMDRIGNNAVARGHMSEPQAETYLTAVAGRKLGSFYVNHPSVKFRCGPGPRSDYHAARLRQRHFPDGIRRRPRRHARVWLCARNARIPRTARSCAGRSHGT